MKHVNSFIAPLNVRQSSVQKHTQQNNLPTSATNVTVKTNKISTVLQKRLKITVHK